jgi:hypothetical protein
MDDMRSRAVILTGMDAVTLDSKTYIASKRAAVEFGYTQDYVGQLCRAGHVDARRVGNQWYVFPESLHAYKLKAEAFKPEPPKYQPDPNVEATIREDGKEFVSAALAAKITDYNQDYVGQLARAGKIPSTQVGNRWYVDREAILEHKKEKEALLRAVQAESVGLKRPVPVEIQNALPINVEKQKLMEYGKDEKPLFPTLSSVLPEFELRAQPATAALDSMQQTSSRIPIRVLEARLVEEADEKTHYAFEHKSSAEGSKKNQPRSIPIPGKSMFQATVPVLVLVLLVLAGTALGLSGGERIYSAIFEPDDRQVASVATAAANKLSLEVLLSKELVYIRSVE